MKTKKTSPSPVSELPCFECAEGRLLPIRTTHVTSLPSFGEVTVPDVPMLRCDQCGDTVIGDEGNRYIDAWLDRHANAITPEEVQGFLTKYRLTQKEASAITGLGEKNLSRWITGRARPSISVSNFLRVLLADESAFEILRHRNFSGRNVTVSYPSSERSPDEEEKTVLKQVDYPKLVQIKVVQATRSAQERRTQLCQWAKCENLIEFRRKMEVQLDSMAAFKDTRQKINSVSAGLWVSLGEEAARHIETEPYDRDKLRAAVKRIRGLTTRPLTATAREVQLELANAGVALVFVPIMKESALRGCTRLLTQSKALIIHGLKYRSLSQFWIVLFHEIAHLLLHISEPGQSIPDYEEAITDEREVQADAWAHDTLASVDTELEFLANHPEPTPWDLDRYARQLHVHPAIAAEILNRRARREVISFSFLNKLKMLPYLSDEETDALIATSNFSA